MTTKEYFDNLLNNISLKLGDDERNQIEEKQNDLREKMREKLSLQDDFLTGSYKRHTIIKPKGDDEKFDVDLFVAFDKEDYGESELADLRQEVIDALHEIESEYTELGITSINETQRRSIGVEFGNNFQIDVVPAVQLEKDKLYKIFDRRTLDAVKSNPKLHGKLLSEANEHTGGLLVPLVKILKSWKREKCDYVKSFHIELMAVKIFADTTIESIPKGLLTFFESAGDYFSSACLKDPANNEMLVDEYLDKDGTREKVCSLIETEKAVAKTATDAEKNGNADVAITSWKEIFEDNDSDENKKVENNRQPSSSTGPVIVDRSPAQPWCNV